MRGRFWSRGEVTIRLKGDKRPRIWYYDTVTVWPEGIGAAACYILDDKGNMVENDVLAGYEIDLLPLIYKHRERYAGWIDLLPKYAPSWHLTLPQTP